VAAAVISFMAAGLVAVVIISIVSFHVVRDAATAEAIREAEDITAVDGRGIVEPALTDGVAGGDLVAVGRLHAIVQSRVLSDRVVRVKIWDGDGRILYSDEPRLIGREFDLGEEEHESLDSGATHADLSDLGEEENTFERPFGSLMEVYLPIRTPSGQRVLFETYQRYSAIQAAEHHIWAAFLPALLGGLLILYLAQVPLAWSMARRLRERHREREELLEAAVDASDGERRRIAGDLHDGVVQTLTAVSFSLDTAAERLRRDAEGDRDRVLLSLRSTAEDVRGGVGDLRTLLIDLAPPTIDQEGIEASLARLLEGCQRQAIATSLRVDPTLDLSPSAKRLVHRVVQEAVRNVINHSGAARVDVSVSARRSGVHVEIEDDGIGFSADDISRRRKEGHVGLSLLADLVADVGGTLVVDSAPGTGSRVSLDVPDQ
jgi:signal transduction histidine kinase